MRILALFTLLVPIAIGGWWLLYPETSDPKNIKYVLWKAGFHTMDVDLATGTMIGDAARNELVIGKSKEQLLDRFGFLLSPKDVSPYVRDYCLGGWPGDHRNVLFIRQSPWMVVFNGGKATELVLMKGC